MTMKTSTESSKTELSSRGKRPFKVFVFSRFFLPQTVPPQFLNVLLAPCLEIRLTHTEGGVNDANVR